MKNNKPTAEETIDKIVEVLSEDMEIGKPEFHSYGSSTFIISNENALDRIFKIAEIIRLYKE